jgi:DNA-binding MarR family transcriptional regulator
VKPDVPPGDPPLFALLNEVGIIEQLARNRFERAQADGLRLPHFSVLNHLVRLGDGSTPGQLARAFQLTKATMTNTLQRLEARGFIRVEADPADGRGKRVFLTAAGRDRRQQAVAALAEDLAAIGATPGLDPAALLPGLRALRAALDKAR